MKKTYDFGIGPVTIDTDKEYTPDPMSREELVLRNGILVCGSNEDGTHGGGSARFAFDQLGAEWGFGEGLTGMSYMFPTLDFGMTKKNSDAKFQYTDNKVSPGRLKNAWRNLKNCILDHPEKKFYITKLGLGIAAWKLFDIYMSFWESGIPLECKNAIYPMELEELDKIGIL